jgi:hypothetical protein
VTVFLLKGKVQGVKMRARRYVGIDVRYFGVGAGYAICVDDESQFRRFWGCLSRRRVAAAILNRVEVDFEALHVAWCMGTAFYGGHLPSWLHYFTTASMRHRGGCVIDNLPHSLLYRLRLRHFSDSCPFESKKFCCGVS